MMILILVLAFSGLVYGVDPNDELYVTTRNGAVHGKAVEFNQTRVNAYLSIPYAQSPTGSLRFQRPQAVSDWSGVRDATNLPSSCYQYPGAITQSTGNAFYDAAVKGSPSSEDCLYLNIWAPSPLPAKGVAVMVWFHGGGFSSGSTSLSMYDPTVIVAEKNVVVVTVQYRLGIFGFLYLNTTEAPGNQGLLDQSMALQWIQANIDRFGGDSNRITIVGQNSGAVSVGLHLLSLRSTPYFNNAIMQSGTSLSSWFMLTNEQTLSRNVLILNAIGCSGNDSSNLLNCLNQLSVDSIAQLPGFYFNEYLKNFQPMPAYMNYAFLPVVDGYFLRDTPENLLTSSLFKRCPILLGSNLNEGNVFITEATYLNYSAMPEITYPLYRQYIRDMFRYKTPFNQSTNSNATIAAIQFQYTNWLDTSNQDYNFDNIDRAVGDFYAKCAVNSLANYYAQSRLSVYLYQFEWVSNISFFPSWFGATHTAEIPFIFGLPFNSVYGYTNEEMRFSDALLSYWTNFAKYDDPNGRQGFWNQVIDWFMSFYQNLIHIIDPDNSPSTDYELAKWPEYQLTSYIKSTRARLSLYPNRYTIEYNQGVDSCAFWSQLAPNL